MHESRVVDLQKKKYKERKKKETSILLIIDKNLRIICRSKILV